MIDLIINDARVNPTQIQFKNHRIYIPSSLLNAEEMNRVDIKFENEYVKNSAGLH